MYKKQFNRYNAFKLNNFCPHQCHGHFLGDEHQQRHRDPVYHHRIPRHRRQHKPQRPPGGDDHRHQREHHRRDYCGAVAVEASEFCDTYRPQQKPAQRPRNLARRYLGIFTRHDGWRQPMGDPHRDPDHHPGGGTAEGADVRIVRHRRQGRIRSRRHDHPVSGRHSVCDQGVYGQRHFRRHEVGHRLDHGSVWIGRLHRIARPFAAGADPATFRGRRSTASCWRFSTRTARTVSWATRPR